MTVIDKQYKTAIDIIATIAKVDPTDGRDDLISRYDALRSLRAAADMDADTVANAISAYMEEPNEG